MENSNLKILTTVGELFKELKKIIIQLFNIKAKISIDPADLSEDQCHRTTQFKIVLKIFKF
jgi:soluble P-type ATPase